MLAYVFWHWPRPGFASGYETRLVRFQQALASAPPPGLRESFVLALEGAAWANGGADAYEDWYLLGGSADLDSLNEAAVTSTRQLPHDEAAAAAGGGTGGVYRLRLGAPVSPPRYAAWFSKPEGLSYPALYDLVRPALASGGGVLWGRQMTLGPAREFCVHSHERCVLPAALAALEIPLRRVWPEDASPATFHTP
ncbi:MAG TPA: hypothetical protein VLE53_15220 [Gemmatimonadaceae bacterium]|nr:hypothetical protein [Gemmatimonadaceae bacterium]